MNIFKRFLGNICIFHKLCSKNKKIVLFFTPFHGNIGDHAITLGEIQYLKEHYPDREVIEFPDAYFSKLLWNKFLLRIAVKKDDILLIHGGGFLGTLWIDGEICLQKALSALNDRKIIIMPQTVFYSSDIKGEKELSKAKKIYKKCKSLTISAREEYSYEFLRKNFQNANVILVPDMALYIDRTQTLFPRSNILLCLRNDLEKTQDIDDYIKTELAYLNEKFVYTDTVIERDITTDEREAEVEKKLNEFSAVRLVVTDRLHGMIFAAMTKTPCVVIRSRSHKVQGVYKWIEYLEYIKFANDKSEIKKLAKHVLEVKNPQYDNSSLKQYYQKLDKEINALSERTN